MRTRPTTALVALAFATAAMAAADGPDDAQGLWLSGDGGAVLRFERCEDKPAALCGRIVWDQDAGKPNDTCGVQVARLERYADGAWRDGWVFDPRDGKRYRGALRIKGGDLFIRAYVGAEILGQTEQLKRVAQLPAGPACKP